ncbi:hypothetical protein TWF506_007302 [Arthrobotrys conoides]|uniref:Uncharacterized protein n=1 Tax=Arthrobotrys conoides TaxID=74498 RepID=A0AAN8PHD4_9PEZI
MIIDSPESISIPMDDDIQDLDSISKAKTMRSYGPRVRKCNKERAPDFSSICGYLGHEMIKCKSGKCFIRLIWNLQMILEPFLPSSSNSIPYSAALPGLKWY